MITVRACPQCGNMVLQHCFHFQTCDGSEVNSVDMPVDKAIELAQKWLKFEEGHIEYAKQQLDELYKVKRSEIKSNIE